MKNTSSLKLRISGIVLIICSVIPFLILPLMAFPSEYGLQWVVTFSMILNWHNYQFSIQAMVGWCYLFSMVFAVVFLAIGILLFIKKARPLFDKKIPVIIVGIVTSMFFLFSAIVNIIQIAQEGMQPTFMFIFYIFTELMAIAAIVFALITTQSKKYNIRVT